MGFINHPLITKQVQPFNHLNFKRPIHPPPNRPEQSPWLSPPWRCPLQQFLTHSRSFKSLILPLSVIPPVLTLTSQSHSPPLPMDTFCASCFSSHGTTTSKNPTFISNFLPTSCVQEQFNTAGGKSPPLTSKSRFQPPPHQTTFAQSTDFPLSQIIISHSHPL